MVEYKYSFPPLFCKKAPIQNAALNHFLEPPTTRGQGGNHESTRTHHDDDNHDDDDGSDEEDEEKVAPRHLKSLPATQSPAGRI